MLDDIEKRYMDKLYDKLTHFNNVRVCEAVYAVDTTPATPSITESRQRMTKQIAQHLLEEYGPMAHMYALEKLDGGRVNTKMWRDVLSWLDEFQGEKNVNDEL